MTSEHACRACNRDRAERACSACTIYQAFYCSIECQRLDWKNHREVCQWRIPDEEFLLYDSEGKVKKMKNKLTAEEKDPFQSDIGIEVTTLEGEKLPQLFDLDKEPNFVKGYRSRRDDATNFSDRRQKDREQARESIFANMLRANNGNYFDGVERLDSTIDIVRRQIDAMRALRERMDGYADDLLSRTRGAEERLENVGVLDGEVKSSVRMIIDKIRRLEELKRQFAAAPNEILQRKIRALDTSTNAQLASFVVSSSGGTQKTGVADYTKDVDAYSRDLQMAQLTSYCAMMRAKYVGIGDDVAQSTKKSVGELERNLSTALSSAEANSLQTAKTVRDFFNSYDEQINEALERDDLEKDTRLLTAQSGQFFSPIVKQPISVSSSVDASSLLDSDSDSDSDLPRAMSQKIGSNGDDDKTSIANAVSALDVSRRVINRVETLIRGHPAREAETLLQSILDFLDAPTETELSEVDPIIKDFLLIVRSSVERLDASFSNSTGTADTIVRTMTFREPPTRQVRADAARAYLTAVGILDEKQDLRDEITRGIVRLTARSNKYFSRLSTALGLGALLITGGMNAANAMARASHSRSTLPSVESLTLQHQLMALSVDPSMSAQDSMRLVDKAFNERVSNNQALVNGGASTSEYLFDDDEMSLVQRLDSTNLRRIYSLNSALTTSNNDIDEAIEKAVQRGGDRAVYDSLSQVASELRPTAIRHLELNRLIADFARNAVDMKSAKRTLQLARDIIEIGSRPSAEMLSGAQRQRLKELSENVDALTVDQRVANLIFQEISRLDGVIGIYRTTHELFLQRLASETEREAPLSSRVAAIEPRVRRLEKLIKRARENLGFFLDTRNDDDDKARREALTELSINLRSMADTEQELSETRFFNLLGKDSGAGTLQALRGTASVLGALSRDRTLTKDRMDALQEAYLGNVGEDGDDESNAELSNQLQLHTFTDAVRSFSMELLGVVSRRSENESASIESSIGSLAAQVARQLDRENSANAAIMRVDTAFRISESRALFNAMADRFKKLIETTNTTISQAQLAVTYLYGRLLPQVDNFVAAQLGDEQRFTGDELVDTIDSLNSVTRSFETWTFNADSSSIWSLVKTETRFIDEWYVSGQLDQLDEVLQRLRSTVAEEATRVSSLQEQRAQGRLNDNEKEELRRLEANVEQSAKLGELLSQMREYYQLMGIWNVSIPSFLLLFAALVPRRLFSKLKAIAAWTSYRDTHREAVVATRNLFQPTLEELDAVLQDSPPALRPLLQAQQAMLSQRKRTEENERYFWQIDSMWTRVLSNAMQGASIGVSDILGLQTIGRYVYTGLVTLPVTDQLGSTLLTRSGWSLMANEWMQKFVTTSVTSLIHTWVPALFSKRASKTMGIDPRAITTSKPGVRGIVQTMENYYGAMLWLTSAALASRYTNWTPALTQSGAGTSMGWLSMVVITLYATVWALGAEAERSIFRAATSRQSRETR